MEPYLIFDQSIDAVCQAHLFAVTAVNDAGRGPPVTIMRSIPVCETLFYIVSDKYSLSLPPSLPPSLSAAPDVETVTNSQMIDRVTLFGETDVNISIAFDVSDSSQHSCRTGISISHY